MHLVTEERSAHLVGHSVNEFPVRLVRGPVEFRICRKGVGTVDERGNQHVTTMFREPTSILGLLIDARLDADKLLRRPVGIGNRDHVRNHGLLLRTKQQALRIDTWQHGPPHGDHDDLVITRYEVGLLRVGNKLQPSGGSLVDHAEDFSQPLPVRLYRFRIGFGRREVILPAGLSLVDRLDELTVEILVNSIDHQQPEVPLGG